MYKILKNIIEMDDYSVQKLSKSQPPEPFQWNTVEGTELNVDDCIGGKGKIEVNGNTYQKQLSGKNLLNYTNIYEGSQQGINTTLIDDSLSIKGTTTAAYANILQQIKKELKAKTYTLSINKAVNYDVRLRIYYEGGTYTNHSISKGSTSVTFTTTNAGIKHYIYLSNFSAGLVIDDTITIQLEEGSTATDFEEYCGGQASPNSDYPQEIKIVTGDNVVKHFGMNLFDFIANLNTEIAGLTISSDKAGNIIVNGTPQRNWVTIVQKVNITDSLEDGQTYTLWQENIESNGGRPWFYVQVGYGENTASNYYSITTASNMLKFTVDKSQNNIYQIMVQTGNNLVNYNNVKNRFMLLKGDYTNKEVVYESYREEEYKLDLRGTNVFDKNQFKEFTNTIKNIQLQLQPNTEYIMSSDLPGSSDTVANLFFSLDTNFATDTNGVLPNQPRTLTTDSTGIVYVGYRNNRGAISGDLKNDYNYYIHETNKIIELCKIGDYSDIPFKNVSGDENYNAELENGAWYKYRKTGKQIVDVDAIQLKDDYENITYITIPKESDFIGYDAFINKKVLCTHAIYKSGGDWDLDTNEGYIFTVAQKKYFWIGIKKGTTLEEAKAKMNGMYIYYPISTPVYEKITDTTLISQLEALRKFKWFKGVNHIWTETDNLEPNLKGTYRQVINE